MDPSSSSGCDDCESARGSNGENAIRLDSSAERGGDGAADVVKGVVVVVVVVVDADCGLVFGIRMVMLPFVHDEEFDTVVCVDVVVTGDPDTATTFEDIGYDLLHLAVVCSLFIVLLLRFRFRLLWGERMQMDSAWCAVV